MSKRFQNTDDFSEVVLDIGHLGPLMNIFDFHFPSDLFFLWAIHAHGFQPFYDGFFYVKNVKTKNQGAKMLSFFSPGMLLELFHKDFYFYRIESHFTYDYHHLFFTKGRAEAVNLGFLFWGQLNTADKKLALGGVLIPAYLFNTILRHAPIVNFLFGGNRGLVSSEFSVKGFLNNPEILWKPLTLFQFGPYSKFNGPIIRKKCFFFKKEII